jgi:hypothetical protein
MSGPESIIIYTAGALLLTITASRFLIQELIALVRLCKQLKVELHAPLPPAQQPVASIDSRSSDVSDLSGRSNSE